MVRSDKGNWTGGAVGVGELRGTKYGLSAAAYPTLPIAELTLDEVKPIYFRDYFVAGHCNMVVGPVAALMFDAAVNNGPGRPARWLQQSLQVVQDGVIGPRTQATLARRYAADPAATLAAFQAIRFRFMLDLPTWDENPGWLTRLLEVPLMAVRVSDRDTP